MLRVVPLDRDMIRKQYQIQPRVYPHAGHENHQTVSAAGGLCDSAGIFRSNDRIRLWEDRVGKEKRPPAESNVLPRATK